MRRVRLPGFLVSLAIPALAAAQLVPSLATPPASSPETRKFQYSPYEQATIAGALASLGAARDEEPEGKVVESIRTVRLEVIEERDPAPRFLNVFHAISRAHVVEREVLLHPGDVYRQTLADETQRKLASISQLSLVLVVAAAGATPEKVQVVVITKDVWSLRLNWNIALTSAGLEGLSVNPSETNLLGTQQTVGLQFNWLPRSYSLGAEYSIPRVLGSHVTAFANAGLTFNSDTGAREGSYGDVELTYPLWSSRTEWSWGAGVSWLTEVTRRYSGGRVASFVLDPQTACGQPSPLCVPDAYLTDVTDAGAFVTRSFGWARKLDLSLGFDWRRSRFRLPDLSAFDPDTVRAYQSSRVPLGDDRVGPYLLVRTYPTSFLRVLDLETLALQEDYRLGLQGYLRVYPILRSLGSTRDVVGASAGASHTVSVHDGLVRAGLEAIVEAEPGSREVTDGSIQATLRAASPRTTLGRLVLDAALLDRYANHLNHLTFLGGDGRLRGYPSQILVGSSVLTVNAEYRSRPWQLFQSVQVGGVLFYDAGDAFFGWRQLDLQHAVGLGVRILFPQLDRLVFRADVGFPLVRSSIPGGASPVSFYVTFGQAFSLYEIRPATAVSR
jgi:hypothetical protein